MNEYIYYYRTGHNLKRAIFHSDMCCMLNVDMKHLYSASVAYLENLIDHRFSFKLKFNLSHNSSYFSIFLDIYHIYLWC